MKESIDETPFTLFPYEGTQRIKFGMSPAEVEIELGPPDSIHINQVKQRVEFRGGLTLGYSDDSVNLNHIGFGNGMKNIEFKGISLFSSAPETVISQLEKFDSNPFQYLGFLIFLEIGLSLTGFHDGDSSQKGASMFVDGAWEKRREKMKLFVKN